jgi:hypothetical protein
MMEYQIAHPDKISPQYAHFQSAFDAAQSFGKPLTLRERTLATVSAPYLLWDTIAKGIATPSLMARAEAALDNRAEDDAIRLDAQNTVAMTRVMVQGSIQTIESAKRIFAYLRVPHTYTEAPQNTFKGKPAGRVTMTVYAKDGLLFVHATSDGHSANASGPLVGYDEQHRLIRSLPMVLVCRDGPVYKCNGAPPRQVGFLEVP